MCLRLLTDGASIGSYDRNNYLFSRGGLREHLEGIRHALAGGDNAPSASSTPIEFEAVHEVAYAA